ncbi:hypothetical protein WR25_02278 [Diploscapter pachys]|uniref:Uncharacterized protein n=1 Tax=Diploscapter pachys TaxID=2018661 RepID=A0A2A2JGS2_9BILA|nr:hypothetical protein WR25_02278 [Diploscapter pachys]
MTDKPILSFASIVSGKTDTTANETGGMTDTQNYNDAAASGSATQTGSNAVANQQTPNKSPGKDKAGGNGNGTGGKNDKGSRGERNDQRAARKKLNRKERDKRRQEGANKSGDEKNKNGGGKKSGDGSPSGGSGHEQTQPVALEPAPLPAVNAWFKNKDAQSEQANKETVMTNGPVNSNNNSTLPSTPTAVSAQTPASVPVPVQIAVEHKHKPKPAEIKKTSIKKDDGKGTDRKEIKEMNGGEIRRTGQGQGKGEQQKQNIEMEWPRLDAANSADELLMTNGNAHEHGDAQQQMGKEQREQRDRHRQQSSPHSDGSEYWLVIFDIY